jgi:hypothetical protein
MAKTMRKKYLSLVNGFGMENFFDLILYIMSCTNPNGHSQPHAERPTVAPIMPRNPIKAKGHFFMAAKCCNMPMGHEEIAIGQAWQFRNGTQPALKGPSYIVLVEMTLKYPFANRPPIPTTKSHLIFLKMAYVFRSFLCCCNLVLQSFRRSLGLPDPDAVQSECGSFDLNPF